MARFVKLLGFALAEGASDLALALGRLPGPSVMVDQVGNLAVLGQVDRRARPRGRDGLLRDLAAVQRRLELACLTGPFLPADPAQARCDEGEAAALLAEAHDAIAAALAGPGACHQWDVVLRWLPEAVVAASRGAIAAAAADGGRLGLAAAVEAALARDKSRRTAALHIALQGVALEMVAADGGPAEAGATVLLQPGTESRLEAALSALADDITEGASADLRGPLPPLSFAAVRVVSAAPQDVARAWRTLSLHDGALPEGMDAAGLRRQWHATATRLHPDHGAADDGRMAEAGAAFRLLRGLLPPDGHTQPWSLTALQRRGGRRLLVPKPARLAVAEAVP